MAVDTGALAENFESAFGRPPTVISEAPGRVNLIGEHTDYNGGFVLPVAIDRKVTVAARANDQARIRVAALDLGACDEFAIEANDLVDGNGWRNYARGCVWALREEGCKLAGTDLAIRGDIPQGSGLSSSAALELSVAGALLSIVDAPIDVRKVAQICQRAENVFVGVQCGIMDQLACALGKRDHALLIDCRSLETRDIPLPAGVAIVVVDSKLPRHLGATDYNQRREDCEDAALLLGVATLRDADDATLASHRLPDALRRRASHVVTENQRVLAAAAALRGGDLAAVGQLMYASHASLRDDFEVSMPELDLLVELASSVEGVVGARLTGAGFGGCTVNLVRDEAIELFRQAVDEPYRERTRLSAEITVCVTSDGLKVSHV